MLPMMVQCSYKLNKTETIVCSIHQCIPTVVGIGDIQQIFAE